MAGKRNSKINLEEVAEKLTASDAAAAGGEEAAAGTKGAKQARSAKKKKGKRAGKKKAAKKTAKKTAKKARKKKKRVQAVPRKRARAKKAKAADAPVERVEHVEETSSVPEEPVELSPEEALALLTQMGSAAVDTKTKPCEADEESAADLAPDVTPDAAPDATADDEPAGTDDADATNALETPAVADVVGDSAEPRTERTPTEDPGILASILGASCRVLTFEGESVDDGMCVARAAVEHLQHMVVQCGLEVSVGPICRTPGDFIAEWDNTPASMPVAIIANLSCAGAFLPAVVDERPRVASAYWIVFVRAPQPDGCGAGGCGGGSRSRRVGLRPGPGARRELSAPVRRGTKRHTIPSRLPLIPGLVRAACPTLQGPCPFETATVHRSPSPSARSGLHQGDRPPEADSGTVRSKVRPMAWDRSEGAL
ncbi:MAG: hypothetical protein ACYS9X_28740 [Planctomycetota bacterium]|jgi:hypothetical protein